jgi:transposase InsO family protein
VTYYVLFFLRLRTREVHIAGLTPHPDQRWMAQIVRNITMADWGFLQPGHYLIHDRDRKFCPAFEHIIDAIGVQRVPLPPRSPDLNAYAERWVRSVKEEALSRLILFGERALRHALTEYVTHVHQDRPHQGQGHVVLLPAAHQSQTHTGLIHCHERLGGLLKYDHRQAT